MPIILKRPIVIDDLAEIWEYIAEDSETRADEFIETIDSKFHELAASPRIGRLRDELYPGLMSFPVGRYLLYYTIITGGIEVIRVLHGARDIEKHFNPFNPEE